MTKHLATALLFFGLLLAADYLGGRAVAALFFQSRVGSNGGDINRAIERRSPTLVLGGSRAHTNVDTDTLSARLGIQMENLGADGHGLVAWLMIFDIVTASYTPERVLIVVDEASFSDRPDVLEKARFLAPYIDQSALTREVLYGLSPFERIKYASRMYRFNGKLLSSLKNYGAQLPARSTGFVAVDGQMGEEVEPGEGGQSGDYSREFDPWRTELFTRFLQRCRRESIDVTVLTTPSYHAMPGPHARWRARLLELLDANGGIRFVEADQYVRPDLFSDPGLFRDRNHMNVAGTARLTTLLEDLLRREGATPR